MYDPSTVARGSSPSPLQTRSCSSRSAEPGPASLTVSSSTNAPRPSTSSRWILVASRIQRALLPDAPAYAVCRLELRLARVGVVDRRSLVGTHPRAVLVGTLVADQLRARRHLAIRRVMRNLAELEPPLPDSKVRVPLFEPTLVACPERGCQTGDRLEVLAASLARGSRRASTGSDEIPHDHDREFGQASSNASSSPAFASSRACSGVSDGS